MTSPTLDKEYSPLQAPHRTSTPFIYIVDDMPHLTELYGAVLEDSGYSVKTFTDRTEAVLALQQEETMPDLLIMDYLGHPMPADRFIRYCRLSHPALRILMASGIEQIDALTLQLRPDRIIRKPFTPDEFRREVKAVLITD